MSTMQHRRILLNKQKTKRNHICLQTNLNHVTKAAGIEVFLDPKKMRALSREQIVWLRIVPKIRIEPRAFLHSTRPCCA